MNTFYIKQGDLWPPLEAYLKQGNNEPIVLQGLDTVSLVITPKNKRNEPVLSELVNIVNREEGFISYTWQTGDTDIAGNYQGEFIILLNGDKELKVPNNGYFNIIIDHKLGE